MADSSGDPPRAAVDVLRVSLFGGCAISLGGREIVVANRKGKAIIGYLAFVPGHRETRERLAGHFWGELSEVNARMNLRQTLKSVRDTLEAAGFKGFDTLYADPGFLPGTVVFDVVEAIESIAKDWPVDALIDQPRIAETLLAGFEDVDPTFRNWLAVKRESLSRRFARDLQDRMNAQPGATAAAARLARALLMTDPTHEPAARKVMTYQADSGDLAGAVAEYNRLCEEIGTIYDQFPDNETQKPIVAIKDGSYRPSMPPPETMVPGFGFVGALPAPSRPPAPQEKLVLIIGRFEHVGGRKELTYAFRHELSSRLARFREWLLVDGEPAVLPVSGNTPCYTLSAPLMEGDGAVNLMLSLKDSRTDTVIWGETFNIELRNFFRSLQEVMRQIAAKLNVYISVERLSRATAAPEVPIDVYDRWVLGQWLLMQWSPGNRLRARHVFESITQTAPRFSPAYSSLAQLDNADHIVLAGTFRTIETQQRSLSLARTAMHLDPLDSRAHLSLGWSNAFCDLHDLAEIHFAQARLLNEDDGWTATSAALGYGFSGNLAKARETADVAMSLLLVPTALHWCYQSNVSFACGELERSLIEADRCGDAVSNMPAWRAANLALLGQKASARREAERFLDLMRADWRGDAVASAEMITKWFLHCFPIRKGQVFERLRQGLAAAGLPV